MSSLREEGGKNLSKAHTIDCHLSSKPPPQGFTQLKDWLIVLFCIFVEQLNCFSVEQINRNTY